MIIEEEVYAQHLVNDVDIFLEHHGVRGMKWGVRKAEAVGRGAVTTAKAVGRGAKATVNWSRAHPKTTASIAAGAVFAGLLLSRKIAKNSAVKADAEHWKKVTEAGIAWRTDNSTKWRYGLSAHPSDLILKSRHPADLMVKNRHPADLIFKNRTFKAPQPSKMVFKGRTFKAPQPTKEVFKKRGLLGPTHILSDM